MNVSLDFDREMAHDVVVVRGSAASCSNADGGFRPPRPMYTDDMDQARRSLLDLWDRLAPYEVESVCTAHAKCGPYTAGFRSDVSRD